MGKAARKAAHRTERTVRRVIREHVEAGNEIALTQWTSRTNRPNGDRRLAIVIAFFLIAPPLAALIYAAARILAAFIETIILGE